MKNIRALTGIAAAVIGMTVLADDLSLNGSWDFAFEEGRSIEEVGNVAFKAAETIAVPGCYDMMPKWLCKRGTGLYRRTFRLGESVENAWLVVDGMGLRGNFKIDGKDLGTHPYPYAKLKLPTGPLAAGEHTLYAALDNRFDWETMKLARPYYDFYCFGGFYHGVSLEFSNSEVFVRTRDYKTGEVELELVNVKVGDGAYDVAFDGGKASQVKFVNARAKVNVPDFKLWSPDAPNLHHVRVMSGGREIAKARFGIREIKAGKREILLNGKPIYLKGANRHESHPTFGAATSEALMVLDIQNLKGMGGNFIRGAHYQQSQRFLDLCDENGVMVWEESLGWQNGGHPKEARYELTNEVFCAQQIHQTREMVRASFNHPSVIIFAFMNEFGSHKKEGKALADKIIDAIKAEDSGRLVTFACCQNEKDISNEKTDIVAFNTYPGWFGPGPGDPENMRKMITDDVNKIVKHFRDIYPDKPIMVSEMGVCSVYGYHDPAGAQWTEDFHCEYLGDAIDAAFGNPDVCGFTIWQFTDARSYHRGGAEIRGKPMAENLAGLYDGFRRAKSVVSVVRKKFAEK